MGDLHVIVAWNLSKCEISQRNMQNIVGIEFDGILSCVTSLVAGAGNFPCFLFYLPSEEQYGEKS